MAGYCDNFSMIDGDSSNFSMTDGGDQFYAFPGLKGEDGTTFYPHVSAEGVLSWTNDGGKPNPDPVNIKGADGKSAYEAAVEAGFTGTESEFNEYLSGIGDLTALTDRKAGMLVDTASGAIASFVPDSTIDNLLGVSVAVEPVQAGSGDPSPDNVRPISGWDAVGIEATGKNVFDKSLMADASTGAKFITLNLAPNTEYTMSTDDPCKDGGTITDLFFCRMDESVSSGTNGVKLGKTVTRTSDADGHLRVGYRCYEGWITPAQLMAYNTQVEVGTTASNYVPFATPTTYTITLGQTVYGGTLDVTNGTMTVEWTTVNKALIAQIAHVSGIEYRFNYGAIPEGYYAPPGNQHCYCTHFDGQTRYSANVPGKIVIGQQRVVYFTADGYTTDELLAMVTGDDFKIVYPLANPITIQLDPVTISTIANQTNNVWADAGDVSVEYAADIKAYIDKLNQSTEDDMVANNLIQSGKYFTINNRLFLSTASIAAGAQIIPGTNCTETSLAAALNALNA